MIGGTAITDIDREDKFSPLYDLFYALSILGNGWDSYVAYNDYGWDNFDFALNAT